MNENTGGIHPLLIAGVIIFILPVITNIFNLKLPDFVSKIGILLLIVGIILTIYYSLKAR
jgi:uncharacterized membrane protein HdeD (DUF308 family)